LFSAFDFVNSATPPRFPVQILRFDFVMTKAKAKTKMKTHKATKKRFRLSATGKAMHRSAGTSHLATGLTKKRRRNLRGTTAVHECMEKTIQTALGGYSN